MYLYFTFARDYTKQILKIASGIVGSPRLNEPDWRREKEVIIEEIKGSDADPDKTLWDEFYKSYFPNHGLGTLIAGTPDSVSTITSRELRQWHAHLMGRGLVIVMASDQSPDRILDQLQYIFGREFRKSVKNGRPRVGAAAHADIQIRDKMPSTHKEFHEFREWPMPHYQFVLAMPGVNLRSRKRFPLILLNIIFGGSLSSRLIQTIREKHGLVYHISSFHDGFLDEGVFGISGSTSPQNLTKVLHLLNKEWKLLKQKGVKKSELDIAKKQVMGHFKIRSFHPETMAQRAGTSLIVHGRIPTLEETLSSIKAVSVRDVKQILDEFPDKFSSYFLGPKPSNNETFRSPFLARP